MTDLFPSYVEHSLGHVYEDNRITVFYGDRRSTPEDVSLAFPDFRLLILSQTHSDRIVLANSKSAPGADADAHVANEKHLALCIRTADCVPIMIENPATGHIAAIHAGWRGIENEIIRKTGDFLNSLRESNGLGGARAWIGPHIGVSSFEVGLDVAQRLQDRLDAVRAYTDVTSALHPHPSRDKKYVDLLAIARAQLRSIGIESDRVRELTVDTCASAQHCSFRRDRDQAGRQISFIAMK
jgi:YfiH family protein